MPKGDIRMMTPIRALCFVTTSLMAIAAADSAVAQASTSTDVAQVEEVVVTGTRGQPRTVQNSPVPIDVIPADELRAVASNDTIDVLKTLVPSYNVTRQVNSNTGTFIRPVSIRGLPEDKTLLLMNGKRRHKSASVATSGPGAQGADASVIPSIALKSVEVLRDGAAAQYGSDAIAGVVNFTLRDDRQGVELTAQTGQYYEGDGTSYQISGNIGLPILEDGFVDVAFQLNQDQRTSRGKQFTTLSNGVAVFDATAYAAANPAFASYWNLPGQPIQRNGQPDSSSGRVVINAGYDFGDAGQVYGFANLSQSRAQTDANFRYPTASQPVLDTAVRLADGSTFKFNQLFPYGLRPQFAGYVTDYSLTGGYKNTIDLAGGELAYDVSGRYGYNKIIYKVFGTLNASVGPTGASKMDFRPLEFQNKEKAVNADFTWTKDVGFHTPLAFSFGGELRKETYTIVPGEAASYETGAYATPDPYDFCTGGNSYAAGQTLRPTAPQNMGINCASSTDPVYRTLPVGPNVFNGNTPAISGDWSQKSKSVYVEAATDITERLFVDLAARYEDFNTFGSTTNYKAAGRYEFTDWFSLRGSIGTGFHAPSVGVINMTSIALASVNGVSVTGGLFPAYSPVAVFLGAKPLKPEESKNYSLGFTLHPIPGLDITVDGYRIDIEDQLYTTSNITVTTAIQDQLVAANVLGARNISSVRFIQNAFDSKTSGFDVVGTYRYNWENGQRTTFTASFNHNTYEVGERKLSTDVFNAQSLFNFENNTPKWRGVLGVTHKVGPFTVTVRDNIFGPYKYMWTVTPFPVQKYKAEQQIDAEVKYDFLEKYQISVGARNIFDNYPDPDTLGVLNNGNVYRDTAVDFQGGFYYVRFTAKF
jgi:iron complex outermembrane receptor protein